MSGTSRRGWAGFGAAYAMLEAGLDVTLLDAAANPGGLSTGWRTVGGRSVEAGIKGFWYQYRNIEALVAALGIPNPFTDWTRSSFFAPDGLQVQSPVFQQQPRLPTPLGNFIYTSRYFTKLPLTDRLTALPLVAPLLEHALDEDSYHHYDNMSAKELFLSSGVSQRLYREFLEPMLLVTLFAPGEQLSAAAALGALYYFVLAHQADFDVRWCRGPVAERIFRPFIGKLEALGGRILAGRRVQRIEAGTAGLPSRVVVSSGDSVEVHECDVLVFSVGVGAMQRIVASSPVLTSQPNFQRIHSLSTVDVVAVRIWLDRHVAVETASNVMAGFDAGMGATFFDLNALQDEYQNEPGAVIEVDFYHATMLLPMTDAEVLEVVQHKYLAACVPGIQQCKVLDSCVLRFPGAVTAFTPGSHQHMPTTLTSLRNTFMAADWLAQGPGTHGAKGLSQEKAYVAGLLAGNEAAKSLGLEPRSDDDSQDLPFTLDDEAEPLQARRRRNRTPHLKSWWQKLIGKGSQGYSQVSSEHDTDDAASSPKEAGRTGEQHCPEEHASFLSWLFFAHVTPFVQLGSRKVLQLGDLWDLRSDDATQGACERFERVRETTKDAFKAPQGVLWRALWRTHKTKLLTATCLESTTVVMLIAKPLLLRQLLLLLEGGGSTGKCLMLAIVMAVMEVIESISNGHYWYLNNRVMLQVKAALINLLYQKSLRISCAVRSDRSMGAIVNLQSNDASKVWNQVIWLNLMWSCPAQVLANLAILMSIMGWAPALAGLLVTIALTPVMGLFSRKMLKIRKEVIHRTDARMELLTEVILGIKAIKLYAWEALWGAKVTQLRDLEMHEISRAAYLDAINSVLFRGGSIMVSIAAFSTHYALGYSLTPAVAFPALALFDAMTWPVGQFPHLVTEFINTLVALNRIQKFVEEDETEQRELLAPAAPGEPAISIRHGTFAWEVGGAPVLTNVEVEVGAGQLVMVVGEVGAGKSSLLAALLGELQGRNADVVVAGSIAYSAQDPWVQNATLRDNITLGQPLDEARYQAVLSACALLPDLALLPAGDQTEIGEKGINLSGGQKHRVTLARSCYAAADVYLLDDPLSAIDAHVGQHVFAHCICGLLGGTTRVLVTHQLQYLPAADLVVVVSQGRLSDIGTYAQLVERGVEFKQFEMQEAAALEGAPSSEYAGSPISRRRSSSGYSDRPLSLDIARRGSSTARSGNLDIAIAGVLGRSAQADSSQARLSPGSPAPIQLDDISNILRTRSGRTEAVNKATPLAAKHENLSLIHSEANGHRHGNNGIANEHDKQLKQPAAAASGKPALDTGQLIEVEERAEGSVAAHVYRSYLAAWGPYYALPALYLGLTGLQQACTIGQSWWLSVWSNATTAAERATGAALDGRFYLTVFLSLGVVALVMQAARSLVLVVGTIAAARRLHERLLAKVLRLPMSFFDSQPTGRLLNRFARDTEAIDVQLSEFINSAIYCIVNVLGSLLVMAVVSPLVIIFALPLIYVYDRTRRLYATTAREVKRLDSLAKSPIFSSFGETLQGLVTVRAFRRQGAMAANNMDLITVSNRAQWAIPLVNRWMAMRMEMIGIAVVFLVTVSASVVLRRSAGLAGLAISAGMNVTFLCQWLVRQVTELEVQMNSVERVVAYTTQFDAEADAILPDRRPPPEWPQQGTVKVEQLVVRYRPDLEPVIRGISFEVRAREKVGVAGRTGCGKSTLMMALFRIVEPCGGRIVIDGIDVGSIGLHDLRSKLALVPQDPVIFSGTVRSNLDPFDRAGSDAAIWAALHKAGMAETLQGLEGGLDAPISEGGNNLSTGQRQLLCMARALLRNARILVLDEATASVDNTTDAMVQQTVRTAFKDCTVLTIAHRLHTIVDSDRILVLDAGRICEFDTPKRLLKNPASVFAKLVQDSSKQHG
ncbi:hypothetical protein WJX72_003089 [[Myrmecia] bisecta]|uniref:Uncharacterized protein n=1 Tax=[Myrmecia] bisecta TaxID=41462 RepID=A0AAW1QPS6_9CHLO